MLDSVRPARSERSPPGASLNDRRTRDVRLSARGRFDGTMILAEIPTDQIVKLSLALLGLIVVGFIVVAQVRRRLQDNDAAGGGGGGSIGFTLSDLRQMHKSGQMSDREFELAKAKIIDAAKRTAGARGARKQAGSTPSAAPASANAAGDETSRAGGRGRGVRRAARSPSAGLAMSRDRGDNTRLGGSSGRPTRARRS